MNQQRHLCILRPDRRGFTLVELLVVITIIAVLASLLLPALRKAKETAIGVRCRANMSQIGTAFFLYAGDNDGYFPPTNIVYPVNTFKWNGSFLGRPGPETVWIPWDSAVLAGRYLGNTNILSSAGTGTDDHIPSTQTLYCPSVYNAHPTSWFRNNTGVQGIGYNHSGYPSYPNFTWDVGYNASGGFSCSQPYLPMGTAATPSRVLTLTDVAGAAFSSASDAIHRHNGAANVALMDGHVSSSRNLVGDTLNSSAPFDLSMK